MDSETQLQVHGTVTHVITLPPCGFKDPFQFSKIIKSLLVTERNLSTVSVFLVCLSSVRIPEMICGLSQVVEGGMAT